MSGKRMPKIHSPVQLVGRAVWAKFPPQIKICPGAGQRGEEVFRVLLQVLNVGYPTGIS